jgi:hypothetical protein
LVLTENYKISKEHIRLIDECVKEIWDEAFTVKYKEVMSVGD